MNKKIFKVKFQGRLGAGRGVWKPIIDELTILADTEEEAKKKFKEGLIFELDRIVEVREVKL